MADSSYVIKHRPPVRALLIAAVTSVVGAALLVLAMTYQWHVALSVTGGVLVAVGLLLFVLGLLAMNRGQATLTFTRDGYQLTTPQGTDGGNWADVTRVTQSGDGHRVTIFDGDEARHTLAFSPGSTAEIEKVLADLSARLDKAKGYRNF